jgi:cell division protein FtsQ
MWDSPRVINGVALVIATLALLAFAAGSAAWASRRPMFTLKTIRVEPMAENANSDGVAVGGFRHINAPTIRQSQSPSVLASASGNFFTVNLESVRRAFETVPWVRRAQVRREWPNRLVVTIEEQQVLGAWDDGRFVNTFGELFTANSAEAEEDDKALPDLAGPEGSERDVASRYLDFKSWFAKLSLVPDQVTLSPRYAWSVHFDNGTDSGLTVDLGRERDRNTVPERVARLLGAWSELTSRWPKPTLIDLRYPNGFALRAEGLRLADEAEPAIRSAVARSMKPGATKTRPVQKDTKAKR